MTKLNQKKIRWIVRHCAELRDFSTKEAAEIYHITQRRVQQILKQYEEAGEIPMLKKERRPKTEENGIRFIPSRKNNPQTNGKVERFWLEYDRHRWRFKDIHEFISWYNNRIHGALWIEIGETPEDAHRCILH